MVDPQPTLTKGIIQAWSLEVLIGMLQTSHRFALHMFAVLPASGWDVLQSALTYQPQGHRPKIALNKLS